MKEKQTRTADTVFCGGTVITMEDPVEAREMDLAVGEGKILALGQKGELSSLISNETRIVDVAGKTVMPGLIDVHNHMMWFGQYLEMLELSPFIRHPRARG